MKPKASEVTFRCESCSKTEVQLMELEGCHRGLNLQIDQMTVDIKIKDSLVDNLREDNERKSEHIKDLEEEIKTLEEELKKNENIEELEELVVVVKQKNERIEELEEALRQSVRIATDMEDEKRIDEENQKEMTEKLAKLEVRLASSQNAQLLRCSYCRPLKQRLGQVESKLNELLNERHQHLEELFDMKHEALTSALSEKDAHLAILEVGGIRTSRQAQELQTLKHERSLLMDAINNQSEDRVRLIQVYGASDFKIHSTPTESPPPEELFSKIDPS